MIKKVLIFGFIVCISLSSLIGQSAHSLLRGGDDAYDKGNYATAEEDYRKASEEKPSFKSDYNLANTLYKQDRFEEATQYYQSALPRMKDGTDKAQAYHNLGNSLFEEQKLKESIEAYKQALRISPKDMDTKYNLQKTKQLVKMQEQQQQEQQQQDQEDQEDQEKKEQEEQEKQDQEDQGDQDQENEKEEEQKDQDDDQSDKEASDQEGSSNTGEEDKQELDKEDALKLLQVIENEEKKVQEKMRRIQDGGKKPEKDW